MRDQYISDAVMSGDLDAMTPQEREVYDRAPLLPAAPPEQPMDYTREEALAHAYHGNVEETAGGWRPTARRYPVRGLRRLGAVSRKLGGIVETGPQRAERRAAARGLTVGVLVRADIGMGRQAPPWESANVEMPPTRYPRWTQPQKLSPLDFGQRAERYAGQGPRRHLTAAQYRRANHKANHAAAPFGLKRYPA